MRQDRHADKSVWCYFVTSTMGIKATLKKQAHRGGADVTSEELFSGPVKVSIMLRFKFTSASKWKLTMTTWDVAGKKLFELPDDLKLRFQTASRRLKKRSFNSRLEGDTTGCLMWENSRAIRESAEFQINFKPLSSVNAKPQQLSCCDLILLFGLSPLLFSQLWRWRRFEERERGETGSQEQPAALAKSGRYSQNLHLHNTVIAVALGIEGNTLKCGWQINSESWLATTCFANWRVREWLCRVIKTLFFVSVHSFTFYLIQRAQIEVWTWIPYPWRSLIFTDVRDYKNRPFSLVSVIKQQPTNRQEIPACSVCFFGVLRCSGLWNATKTVD